MIIGFSGKMGSGKSEAVKFMRENYGDKIALVKFAQPLYDIQEAVYDRISQAYSRPESFIKDRKLLQWLGTEWGRGTISETLWVDIWKAEVRDQLKLGKIVVCDDVRFDNEAEALREMGGKLIQINSNRNKERIDTASGIPQHASENGIKPKLVDFVVNNDETIQEYQRKLGTVLQSVVFL